MMRLLIKCGSMRQGIIAKIHGRTVAFLDFMSTAVRIFPSRCVDVLAISMASENRP